MKRNLSKELLYLFFLIFLPCAYPEEQNLNACQKKEKSVASLNLAKKSLQTVKELYPNCSGGDTISNITNCGTKEKAFGYLDVAMNLVNYALENYPTCVENEKISAKKRLKHRFPMDCSQVLENGYNVSGVYTLWLKNSTAERRRINVFCDMDTESGGWTVIQRRGDFPVQEDFFRDWASYKEGFGNITKDFWLGNDNIFVLSNQSSYSIRFDLEDANGTKGFAHYKNFKLGDESTKYILHISGYSGNIGDSMKGHDGKKFSTKDNGNDESPNGNYCAKSWKGGWWYAWCYDANLNGVYRKGAVKDSASVTWIGWRGNNCLNSVEIKLKPLRDTIQTSTN